MIGQDIDPDAAALRFCHETVKEVKDCKFDLLVPTRDKDLLEYSGSYKEIASRQTVETCVDKFRFYKFCKQHGFKSPEVYFVKPRVSKSGKETECVWQEFVEGKEYSVDLFSDFNGNVLSVVPRSRLKVINGESWVSQTFRDDKLVEEVIKLSRCLRLIGHNVLQCFHADIGYVWTDVNARFGGGSALAIKAGCKSPLWLKKIMDGKKVDPSIGEYEVGLKMLCYKESFYENVGNRRNRL